ncbi:Com family DNA-binding transcriptional regulator [Labrenzia sp. R4_2]|uniref:Com family DNA-binding transcriptional regulator n=1 Tax=Labrenzia sp. R4_2 TaxID=2821107 RepID=UPI001AD98E4E|nr:Com family DNA-binding transcriptional regulator [Labrenzia sp. R4_2]
MRSAKNTITGLVEIKCPRCGTLNSLRPLPNSQNCLPCSNDLPLLRPFESAFMLLVRINLAALWRCRQQLRVKNGRQRSGLESSNLSGDRVSVFKHPFRGWGAFRVPSVFLKR